ncbi:MAG: flagellar M-ring protein FliF C-terminal domain-containing protein [Candidatus Margulisbacteria bacterium]|nr:flagellar M-ring protein FliF C-terminal domain-containing protein [Candidatus Margulisiibacteriota bacterium]
MKPVKEMDKNQRNFLLLLLFFFCVSLAGLWTAFIVSNFEKPDYIRKQEFFQKNATKILDKMLGHNNYIVNISLQYAEVQKRTYSVQYVPRDITERYQYASTEQKKENTSEDRAQQEQADKSQEGRDAFINKAYRLDKPEVKTDKPVETPEVLGNKSDPYEKLPGLAPRNSKGHIEQLPGFPKVNPYNIENKAKGQNSSATVVPAKLDSNGQLIMPQQDTSEKEGRAAEGYKNKLSDNTKKQSDFGIEKNDNRIYTKQLINESKETVIIPESKIERLHVSLVLNKDRLKELDITKEEMASFIQSVVGYTPERGDKFYIISYSFKGLGYTLKKNISLFSNLVYTYRLFFIIVLGVPLFCYLIFILTRYILKYRREQQRRQHELEIQQLFKQEKDVQTKADKQQEEIIGLAKAKPEEFAKTLIDWIEKMEPQGSE